MAGSHIIDFRRGARDETPPSDFDEPAVAEAPWLEEAVAEESEEPLSPWRDRMAAAVVALLAIAWIALLGLSIWGNSAGRAPIWSDLTALITIASPPLALLGVLYLLLMRSSAREARRFARTSAGLRTEARWLETVIADSSARLDGNRAALHEQTAAFMRIGEEAAARVKIVTDAMQSEVDTLGRQSHALKAAATAARADMAVLLADLPKAEVQTRRMTEHLREAGLGAHESAAELQIRVDALAERGRAADEIASGAANRLAAHLVRMESTSETAGARLEAAAAQMTEAVDAALARAADALEEARKGMEAQGSAMLAMLGQTQAALGETGDHSARAIAERVDDMHARIGTLGTMLAGHADTSRALTDTVAAALGEIDAQLAALGENGTARTNALGGAIGDLGAHADRLNAALATGAGTADVLIQKSEALFTGLDANARELDENLPAALARLDAQAGRSKALLAALGPDAETLEMTVLSAANRLAEVDETLQRQRVAIDGTIADMTARIAANRDGVSALDASIDAAGASARQLAEGAGPQLIETLVRVRETANQASERAREAIARIVPETAAALAEASDQAMAGVFRDRVAAQIAEMTAAAERAVGAAQTASERLTRQLMTIAETSGQLEERAAAQHEEGLSGRVSLLIDSLNSTAIDVTKILSNDVTDTAWAAYLKGDRGVFTRRAVRLLDAGEVREIARHYEADADFREHVNRYIHDFEAILRNVLGTREGSPLAVTLLSSDMGKLYVALAQAIDRLRT